MATPQLLMMISYKAFIDVSEAIAIRECLSSKSPSHSLIINIVIPVLSRFNSSARPSSKNLRQLLLQAVHFALICQPCFVIVEMKGGILQFFPRLTGKCAKCVANELSESLPPTSDKAWNMVCEPTCLHYQERG